MPAVLPFLVVAQSSAPSLNSKKIIVASDGSGDYKTIQGAINSLPDSSTTARTIFMWKGTYKDKLYI
jgi:pectinesterase